MNPNPNVATPPQKPAPAEGQNFIAVLTNLRRGATVADLSDQLRVVTAAVRDTGKKGVLTLKLVIVPNSKGDPDVLRLEDEVTAKVPVAERGASIFFANDANELLRQDPRQRELPFTEIEGGKPKPEPIAQAAAGGLPAR